MQVAGGFAFAAAIALLAYRARTLDASGAVAAVAVGTAIFATLGWAGAAVLLSFFVPASALTRLPHRATQPVGDHDERRTAAQVSANGAVAALCALGAAAISPAFAAGFAGAFAAAAANTWGTEIGVRFGGSPVSILSFRRIARGRSGGVTAAGTVATVVGALVVAATASALHLAAFSSVAIGGVAGALVDSVLGATLQSARWCENCRCECETKRHGCGALTTLRRGVSWVENDAVNVAATLAGAAVALALRSP